MSLSKEQKSECLTLFSICFAASLLYAFNLDFSLGFHGDEGKKVRFILQGTQDFNHPILMLQFARLLNLLFQETDPEKLA